tara:strand:+ start:3589 stop:4005 length:417 start_codon:yes stop_codon:yes gene_type:complete
MDPAIARKDFIARMRHYEKVYESIEDEAHSYVKVIDAGNSVSGWNFREEQRYARVTDGILSLILLILMYLQVITNKISGYIPSNIVFYMMNTHLHPRTIWLAPLPVGMECGRDEASNDMLFYAKQLRSFFVGKFKLTF